MKQRSLYGSVPCSRYFLEIAREILDLGRYEQIIVGEYLDRWATGIPSQQLKPLCTKMQTLAQPFPCCAGPNVAGNQDKVI